MDIDAFHSSLISIALIANKLHATRQSLPGSEATEAVAQILTRAEQDLKSAKAIIAAQLGFDLCPQCWPPEMLVPDRGQVFRCPECDTFAIFATGPKPAVVARRQLALWREKAPTDHVRINGVLK